MFRPISPNSLLLQGKGRLSPKRPPNNTESKLPNEITNGSAHCGILNPSVIRPDNNNKLGKSGDDLFSISSHEDSHATDSVSLTPNPLALPLPVGINAPPFGQYDYITNRTQCIDNNDTATNSNTTKSTSSFTSKVCTLPIINDIWHDNSPVTKDTIRDSLSPQLLDAFIISEQSNLDVTAVPSRNQIIDKIPPGTLRMDSNVSTLAMHKPDQDWYLESTGELTLNNLALAYALLMKPGSRSWRENLELQLLSQLCPGDFRDVLHYADYVLHERGGSLFIPDSRPSFSLIPGATAGPSAPHYLHTTHLFDLLNSPPVKTPLSAATALNVASFQLVQRHLSQSSPLVTRSVSGSQYRSGIDSAAFSIHSSSMCVVGEAQALEQPRQNATQKPQLCMNRPPPR